MKTASAKAKGRALAKKVREIILGYPGLAPGDVTVTPSGVTGPDLQLSPKALESFPFAIECKKHAAFAVYAHYEQCRDYCPNNLYPVLVIEANRKNPLVVVDAELFFLMQSFIADTTQDKNNSENPV